MNNARCVVYGLSLDGVTHRYIGIASGQLRTRWYGHVHASKKTTKRTAVQCWIASHGADAVVVTVLEQCSSIEELHAAEKRWIRQLRQAGVALLNHTDGGEGTPGWVPTAEQRAAMSARVSGAGNPRYGAPCPEEVKQKISAALTGRPGSCLGVPKTEEHKAKLRGRKVSEETRLKMSEAAKRRGANNKGVPMSEAQKEKLRAAAVGRTASPEARAKMSESRRGKPKSPEHRAAIAAAVKRARAQGAVRSERVPGVVRPGDAQDPGVQAPSL